MVTRTGEEPNVSDFCGCEVDDNELGLCLLLCLIAVVLTVFGIAVITLIVRALLK